MPEWENGLANVNVPNCRFRIAMRSAVLSWRSGMFPCVTFLTVLCVYWIGGQSVCLPATAAILDIPDGGPNLHRRSSLSCVNLLLFDQIWIWPFWASQTAGQTYTGEWHFLVLTRFFPSRSGCGHSEHHRRLPKPTREKLTFLCQLVSFRRDLELSLIWMNLWTNRDVLECS